MESTMTSPSETVLWANALVRSKKNEIHCFVCTDDTSIAAWQEHITNTTHILTLEQFNLTFERRGKKVHCKLCDKDFDSTAIRTHGKSHSVVPWHEPNDKYQRFFENHIVEWKENFYCCLCNAVFLNWSVACLHINDRAHQSLKEKAALTTQFTAPNPIGETYELLVSEGFVPCDATRLECRFCKDNIEFHETTEHVKGYVHWNYKLQFSPKSNKENAIDSDSKLLFKDLQPIESTEPSNQSLPLCFFEKLNERFFCCKVCDCFVMTLEENTKLHVSGKIHMDSLKKYGCDNISLKEGDIYYCKCCSLSIPDLKCLHLHIKEESHFASMLLSNKVKSEINNKGSDKIEITRTSAPVSKIVHQSIPYNYIVKLNAKCWYCKMCKIKVSDAKSIENHVAGNNHAAVLSKYGCDNISLKEGTVYCCKCCHCQIFGCDNVYLHIKGRRHSLSLIARRKQQQHQTDKKNTKKTKLEGPEWRKALSLLINDLSKLAEQLKSKTSVEKPRPIVNQPVNVVVDKISCNICSVVVTNSVELHSHMASHFSMELVHSRHDKNTNNKKNPYLGKVRVEQKNIPESSKTVAEKFGAIEDTTVVNKAVENNVPSDQKGCDSNMNYLNRKPGFSKPSSTNSDNASNSDDEGSSNSTDSLRMRRLPRKTKMQKIVTLLDFEKDYIYDMKDKLRETELGMKLCMVIDAKSIYCLICQKTVDNTLQNYFEHLCSLDHSEYLEEMKKDHALFEVITDQFSELDLAYQYIEEISDELLRCLICDKEVANDDYAIQDHIEEENHKIIRNKMHINSKQNFENIKSRMQCDWYNMQKYWCVPCSANFESEINFVKHLESKKHAFVVNDSDNANRTMFYDFCASCALLWYGYPCTYAYHCDIPLHKWLLRDGHYLLPSLPELAKNLLAESEQFIDDTINYLDSIAVKERNKEKSLIEDLENAVKSRFFNAKAYIYGSRASGLGSPDSDIDVFLDCGNMYDGNMKSKRKVLNLMTDVQQCLNKDSHSWDINEVLNDCRTPIIRANHRATGLSCDISVENGLSVENTKLVKSFNYIFPPCRKLVLFLKQWLIFCDLSGSERISSYALYWYVIFYLQKESILPSVATLIAMNAKSRIIADWEVGVSHEFSYNKAESNYSLKEFLMRFFTFYANFDFRYDVACPLLGEIIKKRAFADHQRLPKEMAPYVAYIENSSDPEPLRIDSVMCIQDPFDLQHNITKAVSKVFLCRFRNCCSKSLDLLYS